jgi:hypothetical protein
MPLISPDGAPVQINPGQLREIGITQQIAADRLQAQHDAMVFDAGVIVWSVLLAAVLLVFTHRAIRRGMVRTLRLADRAAYALGIDSHRIAARWRERGTC